MHCYIITVTQSLIAGCIPLATGGVCFIPNVSVLKKDLKDKLQNGMCTDDVIP